MLNLRSECVYTIIGGTAERVLEHLKAGGPCPTVDIIWIASLSEFSGAIEIAKRERAPQLLIQMLKEDLESVKVNEAEARYLIEKTIREALERFKQREEWLRGRQKKVENFPHN